MSRGPRHQRGLALITAVLVVAIVATVATTLALGEQVWFRQAQNMSNRAQAESLRQGALNYAAILLTRDGKDNKTDHLGELWAKPLPPLPVEDGMIAFTVSDAQGRFNLNNLVQPNGAPSSDHIVMFQRLLIALSLDPGLSGALRDWLDTNTTVDGPGGAEDIEYLSLPQPYRSANQPLQSVDELRLVKGFSAKIVEKLLPYVTALPVPTTINVNTAPDQVLAALFTNLPASALQPVLDSRVNQPFAGPEQFIARMPAGTPAPPPSLYGINTGYFLVTIDIRYGRLQRRTEALIERISGGKPATVLWHRLPPLQFETKPDEKT
ncbi:MAG: type II secretion system minor pseudopilin GspK [Pseudomonadota bacterium]